jgi:hypothetical protein
MKIVLEIWFVENDVEYGYERFTCTNKKKWRGR